MRENIGRILNDQLDYILYHCESSQEDSHRSIHEIRKSIKRIRAVLRLVREEIGYSTYYRENVYFRDLNRQTSELRTFNVLALTLEELASELAGKIPRSKLEPLMKTIHLKRDELLSEILSDERIMKDLAGEFRKAQERISDLPIEHEGFKAFEGGIYRMYSQGREYLEASKKDPDMHLLHDMRKRMKYLWFHIEIIRPIYPGPLKAFANSLENITEKLGIYHDLSVFEEYLEKSNPLEDKKLRETLLDACRFKRESLLPGIMRMALAAYVEEPEDLVHRLAEYWKIFYRI